VLHRSRTLTMIDLVGDRELDRAVIARRAEGGIDHA
jgi:hypothetical protein